LALKQPQGKKQCPINTCYDRSGRLLSYYQAKIPGFIFLGGMPKHTETASHHTLDFYIDESGFLLENKSDG
jgi:hypothetical protein